MALGEASQHKDYLVMAAAFFVCSLQLMFLTTHLPTYLANCGMDAGYSAVVPTLIGGFNIVSSWLFGWLGDRCPKRYLLGGIYILRSVALAFSSCTHPRRSRWSCSASPWARCGWGLSRW